MIHSFSIRFTGVVKEPSKELEPLKETIVDIQNVVRDSFPPDLQHGVEITGMSIHIDKLSVREAAEVLS